MTLLSTQPTIGMYVTLVLCILGTPVVVLVVLRKLYVAAVRRQMRSGKWEKPSSAGKTAGTEISAEQLNSPLELAVQSLSNPDTKVVKSPYGIKAFQWIGGIIQLFVAAMIWLAFVVTGEVTLAKILAAVGLISPAFVFAFVALARRAWLSAAGTVSVSIATGVPIGMVLWVSTSALGADMSVGMLILVLIVAGIAVAVLLLFAMLYWKMRDWLHKSKGLSPGIISVGEAWLASAVLMTMLASQHRYPHALTIPLSFIVYLMVVRIGVSVVSAWSKNVNPKSLLLLRTFGNPQRSQHLLERLARRWRHRGNVYLVGGVDLATSTADPRAMLAFLTFRLKSWFLKSEEDVDNSLNSTWRSRYVDGSFALREFSCTEDCWRYAVQRLAERTDCVLMDLRGFTAEHAGCIFELTVLASIVPMERVLFLVDGENNEQALEAVLANVWSQLPPESPNHRGRKSIKVVRMTAGNRVAVRAIIGLLSQCTG